MNTILKALFLVVSLGFLSCKSITKEKQTINATSDYIHSEMGFSFPNAIGIINDFGKIFTEEQRTKLSKTLYDYEIKTTKQIIVVTVDSIKPYTNIQKYATDLGNHWGVGSAKTNNGLVIAVCKPCKKIGIATGKGTELVLTDSICTQVIDKTIIPQFKNEQYYTGIEKGIIELIEQWN